MTEQKLWDDHGPRIQKLEEAITSLKNSLLGDKDTALDTNAILMRINLLDQDLKLKATSHDLDSLRTELV